MYSAALCRGLIEATGRTSAWSSSRRRIPRLYAAASLKHRGLVALERLADGIPRLYAAASLKLSRPPAACRRTPRIPRLYAAASLKLRVCREQRQRRVTYSAALCRGLIEAGSLGIERRRHHRVFRGFMPRPH